MEELVIGIVFTSLSNRNGSPSPRIRTRMYQTRRPPPEQPSSRMKKI